MGIHNRMTIAAGESLPEATFYTVAEDGPSTVSTADVFAGRTVVLFAVPGAFTPTCHMNHLPGFLEHREAILAKGVDEIAVVSVNDAFVMDGWAKATGGKGLIRFLADPDAAFTRAIGMELDATARGLGIRSQRYAMVVRDGVVASLDVEDMPRQATVSGAAAILEKL